MKKIYLRKSDEGIAFMHINDPVNKNAIDDEFCLQLHGIVDTIKQDKTIKVLILVGLPDIFCTGGTEAFLQSLITHYKTNIEHEYANHLKHFLNIPIPVIAAMEGSATGGGISLRFICRYFSRGGRKSLWHVIYEHGFHPWDGFNCHE